MEPDESPSLSRWIPIALGLSVLWVAYLALFGPRVGSPDGLSPPHLVRTGLKSPAEYQWTLRDLDDKPVSFAQFQGKPVVLNLWATWCPPCRAEMPTFATLAADPRILAKGVTVVCVSTDESPATLRNYVAKQPWKMTILRATSVPPVFLTEGIPATFVIAPTGKIVATEFGPARWDDPAVVDFLEKVAAAPR